MCKAASDGGQRCAAHTRPAYRAATLGTPQWDRAAAQYATTPTGRRDIEARRDTAAARGDIETEVACQAALDRALVLRQAADAAQRPGHATQPVSTATAAATPQTCLDLARHAHGNQQYGTRPYVEAHVEPVGRLLAPYGADAEMTGYLHDIVEDTDITLDDLAARGIPAHVIQAVDGMTKRRHETKEQAAVRARDTSALSRLGKLADNTANRLGLATLAITDPDKANRLRPKYTAIRDILITNPDGTRNPELAQIADDMEAAWLRMAPP